MVLMILFFAAAMALVLDQASKKLVLGRAKGALHPSARSGRRIRVVHNPTIGFGRIRNRSALVLLWAFTVVGTILLVLRAPCFEGYTPPLGLGAAIGGATSNLLDMLRLGVVVDFIDLRIWPVFNIADALIVVGVTVALCSIWL